MEQDLLDWINKTVKFHKALLDHAADLQDLAKLKSAVAEKEKILNTLGKAINDRTEDLHNLEVQSTLQSEKLASELLKAKEEASKIINDAKAYGDSIVVDNRALVNDMLSTLAKEKAKMVEDIDSRRNELAKLQESVAAEEKKYNHWVEKIKELKASI